MAPDTRNRWLLVLAAGLAVFMVTVDASIVNVALPAIGADLGAPAGSTEWIVLGYLLPMVALVLPAGRWLDGVGRRPAAVLSVTGFAAASAVAAASPAIGALAAARVVQGVFGALVAAQVPALVTRAVQPRAGPRARHHRRTRPAGRGQRASHRRRAGRRGWLAAHLPGQRARQPDRGRLVPATYPGIR